MSETDHVETMRFAQLWARDLPVELRVNDIPICTAEAGKMVSQSMPIRHVLLPGDNRLTVELGNIGQAPMRGGWSSLAECTVRIADYEEGEVMSETKGLEVTKIQAHFSEEVANPQKLETTFRSRSEGNWFWTQGPRIDPIANRAQLDAFVKGVHAAYMVRDMEPLVALHEPLIRDFVRAYPGADLEGMIEQTRNKFFYYSADEWSVPELDLSRAVYRPLADGRLIQVLDVDGEPLVRTHPFSPRQEGADPQVCAFRNLIGVFNGRLAIFV